MTGQHRIDVTFSEPVEESSALSLINYIFYKSGHVVSSVVRYAELLEGGETVRLETESSLENGATYIIKVSNIEDLRGNEIKYLSKVSFIAEDVFPPTIERIWSYPDDVVKVVFDEVVDPATAGMADNYRFGYYRQRDKQRPGEWQRSHDRARRRNRRMMARVMCIRNLLKTVRKQHRRLGGIRLLLELSGGDSETRAGPVLRPGDEFRKGGRAADGILHLLCLRPSGPERQHRNGIRAEERVPGQFRLLHNEHRVRRRFLHLDRRTVFRHGADIV